MTGSLRDRQSRDVPRCFSWKKHTALHRRQSGSLYRRAKVQPRSSLTRSTTLQSEESQTATLVISHNTEKKPEMGQRTYSTIFRAAGIDGAIVDQDLTSQISPDLPAPPLPEKGNLRVNLSFLQPDQGPRPTQIRSASPHTGTSTRLFETTRVSQLSRYTMTLTESQR